MKKLLITLTAASIALTSQADDIEIYTGSAGGAQSNVLMVLDTSGSMGTIAVEADEVRYDPGVIYDNSIYGFDPNALYLFRFDQSRRSRTDLGNLSDDVVSLIKNYQVSPDAVACPGALDVVASRGELTASLMFWESGRGWSGPDQAIENMRARERPVVSMNSNAIIECQRGWFQTYSYNGNNYWYIRDSSSNPYTNWFFSSYSWSDAYSVLWSGNYLNYRAVAEQVSGPKTRLDVVKEAAIDVVNSITGISVGLARFSADSDGGFIDIPITPVEDMRADFVTRINSYHDQGGTPLEESMYESYLYLAGKSVKYGLDSVSGNSSNGNGTSSTPSVSGSRVSGNQSQYQAPTALECTPTKIILFSDGEPTNDDNANGLIKSLASDTIFDNSSYLSHYCSGSGECAEELAYHINRNDHRSDVGGTQNITVDTIGGFIDEASYARDKLRNIANAGGGKFYEVNDYQTLYDSLKDSLTEVIVTPTTFTSPTVAVNSFNSLENSDELYFSVFEPSGKPDWKGNLKRYRISSEGKVMDANKREAVDDTGFFSITSQSYWSPEVDGPNVGQGGASSRFTVPRKIFTSTTSGIKKLDAPTGTIENIVGAIPVSTKSVLTDDLLGLDAFADITDSYRDQLIGWILGYTDEGEPRLEIEDPLHSQPVVINYGEDDSVVFLSTNSGYLHAFDTDENNPQEFFSFIPRELLRNPYYYFSSQVSTSDKKRYGLDGALTYWHDDKDYDGIVNNNDRLIIFVGMRRGGHSYYALDVTDRHNPVLLWQKHGQYVDSLANIPAVSAGYERMGQSWSALTPVRIRMGNTARVVLLAGGGYDPDEDGTTSDGPASRFDHDIGNTIYMIDPNTGEVLWDAHDDADLTGSMTSSFPSDVVPVDRNADGFIDMFYATDVGGRVWRFDLDINATDMADFAKGGVIADLNDSTSSTGNRRFYNAPDISYISKALDDYILISVGSGYRAHPLAANTTDYHFLIKDLNAKVTPEDYIAVTMSDLAEWGTEAAINSSTGWYVPLTQASEKILSRSVTVKGSVFFSTYAPLDATTVADCGGDVGTARLYILNVYDPLGQNLKKTLKDENSESDADSEYIGGKFVKKLDRGGLAPAPVVVFTPGDDCGDDPDCEVPVNTCESMGSVTLVGPETIGNGLNRCDQIEQNYWREL